MPESISLNVDSLKTHSGILNLLELVFGIPCLALICYSCFSGIGYVASSEQAVFFLVAFGFLLSTLIITTSSLFSTAIADALPKTLFAVLLNILGCIFYFACSIALIVEAQRNTIMDIVLYFGHNHRLAAGGLGIINAVLYGLGVFVYFRSER